MPSVNNGVIPHPDPQATNRFFIDRLQVWEPFPVLYLPDDTPEKKEAWRIMELLGKAVEYIDSKVKKHTPCNDYFRKLPNKKTFKELWDDPKYWINFSSKTPEFGFTREPNDIAIGKASFTEGNYLVVAATIVHEFAHLGGAPGKAAQPPSNAAETALKFCLLTQQFDPNVFGVLDLYPDGPVKDDDTAIA